MRTIRTDGSTVTAGDTISRRADGTQWVYDGIVTTPDPTANPAFAGRIQAAQGGDPQLFYPPEFDLNIVDD